MVIGFPRHSDRGSTAGYRGWSATWGTVSGPKVREEISDDAERRTKFWTASGAKRPCCMEGPAQRRWTIRMTSNGHSSTWSWPSSGQRGTLSTSLASISNDGIAADGGQADERFKAGSRAGSVCRDGTAGGASRFMFITPGQITRPVVEDLSFIGAAAFTRAAAGRSRARCHRLTINSP